MAKSIFRRALCLCFSLLFFLPGPAAAIKDDGVYMVNGKWTDAYFYTTQSCHHATTQPVTVYVDMELTQVKTTIPAKTFIATQCNIHSLEYDEYGRPIRGSSFIDYIIYPTGVRGNGWIDVNENYTSIGSAYTYGIENAHLLDVLLGNDLMLNSYNYSSDPYPKNDPTWGDLSGYKSSDDPYWSGNGTKARSSDSDTSQKSADSATSAAGETAKVASSGANAKSSASAGSNAKSSVSAGMAVSSRSAATPSRFTVEWEGGKAYVEVVTLGSATSRVKSAGTAYDVDTADLYLDGAAVSGRLAGVYAPNTGRCSLRDRASDSGKLLKKVKAGALVVVLEKGKTYTKINYKGQDGYVLTSCLKFFGEDAQPTGTGTLVYSREKPAVRTTVNIRNKADKSSAKVAEWDTGTQVAVFGRTNGWYEVEYNGVHGYVMESFLLTDE